jgi:hypothetical protein
MVYDEFGNYAYAATMRFAQKLLEIPESSVGRMDIVIIRDIVSIVL